MKNIFIYLIFCSFVFADSFPTFGFDLKKTYDEFRSVSLYKNESDFIAEKWKTDIYHKAVLNDRGLRGFFVGVQYWYEKLSSRFSGDAMYKGKWLVSNPGNTPQFQQVLSIKLGYIFSLAIDIVDIDKKVEESEVGIEDFNLYVAPSFGLGFGFDKTQVFSLGSDIGWSGYGIFAFVGFYYVYQKNHINLSANFKAFPAVFEPKYQSLKLDSDIAFSNNSFAFDIGVGYRVFRHIYMDIRYRRKFISPNYNYFSSEGFTSGGLRGRADNLIFGLNYNF
ncbi:hypothetical protein BKH42_00875 [Helicobacter sp. 13S00482-2]|uniref:hypothetical protein n=1 Tax=Helicobacter sp. 13S00482-2 TaxID=1476200 RepID=UPI000BA79BA9|nr:hypothetical protein [Helicobacter sp. 13S00482-2]PAF54494.1 hypothetical protein BKH42_00875 [Helicobacter sp. 13S00482-2]